MELIEDISINFTKYHNNRKISLIYLLGIKICCVWGVRVL